MRPRRLLTKRTLLNCFFRVNPHFSPTRISFVEYYLFTVMILSGVAELGLTAFLVNAGNTHGTWPSPRYHSLLLFLLFNSTWTIVFAVACMSWLLGGPRHFLANIASWLSVTAVLWCVSAGIFHSTRQGGHCATSPPISRCMQSLAVEALAWTELALAVAALFSTSGWTSSRRRGVLLVRDSRRMV